MTARMCVLVLALLAVTAGVAAGAHGDAIVERAARSLAGDPVYVAADAEPRISASEAADLRDGIAQAGGGIYVAILPRDALHEGRTPESVLRELARSVGRRATYAIVVGGSFRAGSNGADRGRVGELASEAFREHRSEGVAPTLLAFVGGVAASRGRDTSPAADSDDGGGSELVTVGAIAAVAAGGAAALAVRRRRRASAELHAVKEVAEEDLVALADDVRALDLDVEMPNTDPRAREEYARAVASYDRASEAFRRARRPEDLEVVSEAVADGRYAITATKARLEGREPPERRPPCFFDPRHGPSVRDVEWMPPFGEPRLVPVCAADAVRIDEGEEPAARRVVVDGAPVPYWSAGPAFGPWAGGFFGGMTGALLPTLLIGSALGAGLGYGVPDASASGDGFGDAGGGDFDLGDVGGGDFGGDVGGGDFGGGGDF